MTPIRITEQGVRRLLSEDARRAVDAAEAWFDRRPTINECLRFADGLLVAQSVICARYGYLRPATAGLTISRWIDSGSSMARAFVPADGDEILCALLWQASGGAIACELIDPTRHSPAPRIA